MKQLQLIIMLIICSLSSSAQITVRGVVTDRASGKGVEFANVIVRSSDQKRIILFTTTSDKGAYTLTMTPESDSINIFITSANLTPTSKNIAARSQEFNLAVESKVLEIREVVVKADLIAIKRRGDTLTYSVAKYKDANDIAIEDVIKKLPGIEVEKSGMISYQGKPVSRVYVEGLDMMGGRYSVATKNIKADDVASINVYENHQAIRALTDIQTPENAALNITLKASARGIWTGSVQAGVGYEPISWNGEAAAMYFGRKIQSLTTYKTNNTGDNVELELQSKFGDNGSSGSILGVVLPTTPPIDENLYLNNNVHAATTNFLTKIDSVTIFRANVNYAHNNLIGDGVSRTVHQIEGAQPLVINESTYAARRSDRVNVDLNIESNKQNSFLSNTLLLSGDFNEDFGRVLSDTQTVVQNFRLPSISAKNNFHILIPLKNRVTLNIRSLIDYNNQPTSLEITPMIYPQVFGNPAGYPNASQTLRSDRFVTQNSIFSYYTYRRWSFAMRLGFDAHVENMTSALTPMNDVGGTLPVADSMRNSINWQRYDLTIGPMVTYKVGSLSIEGAVFADLMSLNSADRVRSKNTSINRVIANGNLKLLGSITPDLKYSASAAYNEFYGGLYDQYGGFIMSSYNNIALKDGQISHTRMQNYGASLDYSDAIHLIFANIAVAYYVADRNLTYAVDYINSLTYLHSVEIHNQSSGYNVKASFSKHIIPISTVIKVSGSWSQSYSQIMRQGRMLNSRNDMASATFGFNTRFCREVSLDYNASYTRSMGEVQSIGSIAPIDYFVQKGELLFSFGQGFTASIAASHFYNGAVLSGDRNMVFLDARVGYRYKKMEYIVEGRNLLGTRSFNSSFNNDITSYSYSYNLRPTLGMVKVRCTF